MCVKGCRLHCVLMGHEVMCLQACNFVETSKSCECPECSVCWQCVYQWYTPTQYMVMCFRLFTGAMSALSDLYPQVWCHPSHTLWGAVL